MNLQTYLENTYHVSPKMSYSSCSAQPGWNVKISEERENLCVLYYPMEDFFIALVVIGSKEEAEVEAGITLDGFTPYIQETI